MSSEILNDLVWVADPKEGYTLAEVVDVGDGELQAIKLSERGGGAKKYPLDKILPAHRGQDTSDQHFNDNTQLIYLHAASLLRNLKLRYANHLIYTYTAHILIVVNPFQELPVYGQDFVHKYKGKSIGSEPPHIFAIADNAYRNMRNNNINQSIIVSGESGAGKTETSKHIMKYLTSMSGVEGNVGHLEEVILQASPILESFGNAKTTRNKNSSRFGKFTEIHFNSDNSLSGASISHYLLEKSRICIQNANERNYHVFYELCLGASQSLKEELSLKMPEDYRILSKDYVVEGIDDKVKFDTLWKAMDCVGMPDEEKKNVFKVTAAVLHIGNIEFHESESDIQSGRCSVKDSGSSDTPSAVAAKLLSIDLENFKTTLTTREMAPVGKNEGFIRKPLKLWEANSTRDALAKAIYSLLFDWIVARINSSLPFTESASYIGVLDIAGFEYFDHNSYEQFCINYSNEKLQGFFNEKVLKQEQYIYQQEGIQFQEISYLSNDDCIEVIEDSKSGIFSLLDEESKMPQANDKRFSTTIHDKHKKHPKFASPKKSPLKSNQKLKDEEAFVIRHYAGAVCYETTGFLDKNNDAMNPDLESIMATSSDPFITKLFEKLFQQPKASKGKLNFVSVGEKFKKQLQELMLKLNSTNSHFVRCLKPNMSQEPNYFDGVDILQQLHVGGMLEALQLMQNGFPSRTDFQHLYDMYKKYLPPIMVNLDVRTFCEALIYALGSNENDFQFGYTKLFFRAGKYALLDEITKNDENLTLTIVEKVRSWLVRKRWKKFIFAAVSVQRLKAKIKDRLRSRKVILTCIRAFMAKTEYVPKIQEFRRARLQREYEEALRRQKEEEERLEKARQEAEAERKRLEEEARKAKEEEERKEQERQLELARQREKEEEEKREKARREAEAERLRLEEEERKRKEAEEEERKRKEEAEQERLARLEEEREREAALQAAAEEEARREKERQEEEERQKQRELEEKEEKERKEQEKRDHELAIRLARDINEEVPQTPIEPEKKKEEEKPKAKVEEKQEQIGTSASTTDLSKWTYAQLRDTINTSTDLEMLQACRNEFQKRLKAYYNWKNKYENKASQSGPTQPDSKAEVMTNILKQTETTSKPAPIPTPTATPAATTAPTPTPVTPIAASPSAASLTSSSSLTKKDSEKESKEAKEAKKKKKKSTAPDTSERFFRIPFTRPGKAGKGKKKGLWWAHFDGQKIKRQLETHPQGNPVMLVAGKNDAEMCDLTLAETGLMDKPGAEISKTAFEEEWQRCLALLNKDVRAKKIINILEDCGF